MKMKKLMGLLATLVMCALASTAFAADTVSDWAAEYISDARNAEIIAADESDFIVAITREEFCEIIYNTAMAANGHITTSEDMPKAEFADTDNDKVKTLYSLGIIKGKSDTEFCPTDLLTREESATLVVRMVNTLMPMPATEMWFGYDDIAEVSDWASESVQTISNLGFMQGVGDNKFAPKATYTREQAIATLLRVYRSVKREHSYETPLGVITTESSAEGYINFAIESNARIVLCKGNEFFHIEKPVKSLTNQTSAMLVAFDDFAELFGGEWKLTDGALSFTYDAATDIEVTAHEFVGSGEQWPNMTGKVDVVEFTNITKLEVNGEVRDINAQYGGKVYPSYITMYNGELYIPVQMATELMGYEIASLEPML